MITLAPVWTESSQQVIYRRLIAALSRPGTIADFHDLNLGATASIAVLASLCDDSSMVADIGQVLTERDRGLLNAQFVSADHAAFVVGDGRNAPFQNPTLRVGTESDPEGGATVILYIAAISPDDHAITEGDSYRLSGPGIAGTRSLGIKGLDPAWITLRQRLCDYPRGIDLILATEHQCVCLPRTTSITSQPSRKL
jgi:alpha-D-ribose 1-methylphosphonate 5-triphosphate synthase subunit PhnH